MALKKKNFSKGEFLLHQNEDSRHMFVLQKGTVRVFRTEGDEVTFYNDVGPGATVGEIALIDGGPRSASAVALENVETSVIYPEDVEEANKKCPDWLKALAGTLATRTRTVMGSIERNPNQYFESSLVALLVYFSVAEDEKREFELTELIKTCADILRMAPVAIEDYFNILEKSGLVQLSEQSLEIIDLERLEGFQMELRQKIEESHLDTLRP